MKKFKRKNMYINIFMIILLFIGIYVLHLWYVYKTKPVGLISGNHLTINGVTYIAEMDVSPIQKYFSHRIGRTQNGEPICAIDGEDPKDFVYVIGDMWEGTYRSETVSAPEITVNGVSMVVSGKQTSKDPSLIEQVVNDLNASHTSTASNIMATTGYSLYGIDIRLKSLPGLTFPYLLVSRGQHMEFETNMQSNTFLNVDGTQLQQWILYSAKG